MEEGQTATFTVTVTGTSTTAVVVSYEVDTDGVDGDLWRRLHGAERGGADDWRWPVASGTIQIVTATDAVLEPDETLVLKLTAASTAGAVSVADGDGDRRRSRITGTVTVSVGDAQASEGESVQFVVELSGAVSSEVEGFVCDLGRHGSAPRR